jgi:hypothetical protein
MWQDYNILHGWTMEDVILGLIELDDGLKNWLRT